MFKFNPKEKKPVSPRSILITGGKSKACESYKAIRTNVLHLLKENENKTILITSPYAGAGKTTTSANLAITFSQLGKKVLMIDADMRKPTLHKLFSLHSNPGLSNILSESCDEDVIRETPYENLYLLTAGSLPKNPSELLQSDKFSQLLSKLSKEYDTIFIDAPPVDVVTDAVIISQQVSGTILVIRQNATEKDALTRTVNALNSVNAKLLGYILNAVDYEKFAYKYGYYSAKSYSRYRSYYYTQEEEPEKTE